MQDIILKTPTVESVIRCGAGTFEKYIEKFKEKQLFILTDSNVDRLYGGMISSVLGENTPKFVIPAGEKSKNPKCLLSILSKMLECGMRRNCYLLAFGGGVVGDIGGLTASLYMRGVHLVQIPTTLLSQVDSSVGGKTAVDMGGVKNVIGTFYQPEEVIADPLFLATLPKRELRCGLGEIVKYGALNAAIYQKLLKNRRSLTKSAFLEEIIYDCIKHKAEIVQGDERDLNGARKTLNLGHTTGHALELYYGKKSHGEYVLIGAFYELYIARNLNICAGQYAENLEKLIVSVIKNIPFYDDMEEASKVAVHDKKNEDGLISLIVPVSEGKCTEVKLKLAEYASFLKACSDGLRGRYGK